MLVHLAMMLSPVNADDGPAPSPPPPCDVDDSSNACNCPYGVPSVVPLTANCCFGPFGGECGVSRYNECCVFPPPPLPPPAPSPPGPFVEGSICDPTLPDACGNPSHASGSGLTCVPSASGDIPTPPARCQPSPGCPSCTGFRVFSGGEYYENPHGNYRYPRSMPPIFAGMAAPERGGGASYVYDLNVTFRKDAYKSDPTGTTNVTYYFELIGCVYNFTSTPDHPVDRPVLYDPTTGLPIAAPFCEGGQKIRSGEEGKYMENFGKFVDNDEGKGTPFVPVPTSDSTPVSKIFEFLWCPDQDQFQVTVFKQGQQIGPHKGCPYQFRSQTFNVQALQAEKASLQAENDRLRSGCAFPPPPSPPSSPSPPDLEGSNCDPELLNACGNPLNGLTCAQGNTVGFTCQRLTANKACDKLKKVSGGLKWRKTIVEKWGERVEKWVKKEKKWEKRCPTSD